MIALPQTNKRLICAPLVPPLYPETYGDADDLPRELTQTSPSSVENRLSMGHRLPQELLDDLRACLQHFDVTGHLGETETVAEIKRRLRARIAEVEAELKIAGQSKCPPESEPPH